MGTPGGLIITGGRGSLRGGLGPGGGGGKHPAINIQTKRAAKKRPKNFLMFMGSFLS
jgi:hypothetical protein